MRSHIYLRKEFVVCDQIVVLRSVWSNRPNTLGKNIAAFERKKILLGRKQAEANIFSDEFIVVFQNKQSIKGKTLIVSPYVPIVPEYLESSEFSRRILQRLWKQEHTNFLSQKRYYLGKNQKTKKVFAQFRKGNSLRWN